MQPAVSQPPSWRIALAFLLAPALAALLYAAYRPLYGGLDYPDRVFSTAPLYALYGAYPATLMLGLPVFLAFRPRLSLKPRMCVLAGIFVAVTPAIILAVLPLLPLPQSDTLTLANADGIAFIAECAVIGAISGLAFWLIAGPAKPA